MTNYEDLLQQRYSSLSNSLQKVGDHLCRCPESFAVKSAGEVGEEVGVSETTVIRFAYALGYGGYSELQREVREHIFSIKSSLASYQQGKKSDGQPVFERVMHQDRENILFTARNIRNGDFNLAVDKLSSADRILVAGVRSSFAMAHWFAFVMDLIRGDTRLFQPGTDDVILRASEMNEQSVFVAFSFHRYAVDTIQLAKELKARGTFVIGIADSPVAPISKHADVVFSIQQPTQSTLDAAPVCFSLLNALTSAVSLQQPDRFQERLRQYDSNHLTRFFE